MSRRDTIIIALLVNAGLLALLFMLAINNDDEVIAEQPDMTSTLAEAQVRPSSQIKQVPVAVVEKNVNDEVDTFLKQLASEDLSQSDLIDDEGYVEMKIEEFKPVAKAPEQRQTKAAEPREVKTSEDGRYVEVTVKRGDALEKIARSNGTTVDAIKKANQLSSSKLSIGQVLKVPVSSKAATDTADKQKTAQLTPSSPPKEQPKKIVASSETKSVPAAEPQYYTIKSGDNPWKIAKQFNVKFEDLLKLNNLDEERARNLKIGDKVRVK